MEVTDPVDLDTLTFAHPVAMAQLDELARRLRVQLRHDNERVAVEVRMMVSDRVHVFATRNGTALVDRRYTISGAPCHACADTKRYGQSSWVHTCGGKPCQVCGLVFKSGPTSLDLERFDRGVCGACEEERPK